MENYYRRRERQRLVRTKRNRIARSGQFNPRNFQLGPRGIPINVPATAPTEGLTRQNTLEASVYQLGERVAEKIIVIGSEAVKAAIGGAAREPEDIDLSVPEDVYRYLSEQSGWQEGPLTSGKTGLTNGHYE